MITRAQLIEHARTRLFGPGSAVRTLGAELEFIALRADSHEVMSLTGERGTLTWLHGLAQERGWKQALNNSGSPSFDVGGATLSFEPGGQIEYSSPVFPNANALLLNLREMAQLLARSACAHGIELLSAGVDPYNGIETAPLQLDGPRYSNMARCFAEVGPAGARMMRQTAAVQICIGLGEQPERRWRMLNAMAPALTALFANSERYAGESSGFASFRSRCWQELEPSRTGFFAGGESPEQYVAFGLGAKALLPPFATGEFRPFSEWLADATLEDWEAHLSTLFPEVRPKGYFEVRCMDAQPPAAYGAMVALIAGILEDPASLGDAECVIPACTADRLARAARSGLADPELQGIAEDLVSMGLSGCRRLGEEYMAASDLADAEDWLVARLG